MRRLWSYVANANKTAILGHREYHTSTISALYSTPRIFLSTASSASSSHVKLHGQSFYFHATVFKNKDSELILTINIHYKKAIILYTASPQASIIQINSLDRQPILLSTGTIMHINRWIECLMKYISFKRDCCIKIPRIIYRESNNMISRLNVQTDEEQDALMADCLNE